MSGTCTSFRGAGEVIHRGNCKVSMVVVFGANGESKAERKKLTRSSQ